MKHYGIRLQNGEHNQLNTALARSSYALEVLTWAQTAHVRNKPHLLCDSITVELPNVDRLRHADGAGEISRCTALIQAMQQVQELFALSSVPDWRPIVIIPKTRAGHIASKEDAVLRMHIDELRSIPWKRWARECAERGFSPRIDWGKLQAYADDWTEQTGWTWIPYAGKGNVRTDTDGSRYVAATGVLTEPALYVEVARWMSSYCKSLNLGEFYIDWKHFDTDSATGEAVSWPDDHYNRPIPPPVKAADYEAEMWSESVELAASHGLRVVTQFYNPPTEERAAAVIQHMDDFGLISGHPQP